MKTRRAVSMVLALVLALSLFPVTTLGAESANTTALTQEMFTVDTEMEPYTGSPVTKTITGKDGDRALVEGQDYTVSYADNLALGTAKITITGMGDYTGTLNYTFKIDLTGQMEEDFWINDNGMLIGYVGKDTDVVIPEGVVGIPKNMPIHGADSITLPSTLVTIGSPYILADHLTNIYVNDNNPAFSSQDGVLFNKDKTRLIYYPSGKTGSYTIPDGVKEIESYAFVASYGLTDVTFPDSMEIVGENAFDHSGILSVGFGEGLSRISAQAFCCCENLTDVVIPEGLDRIDEYAFSACRNLKRVVLPKSAVGRWGTFNQCEALTDIYYTGSQEEWNTQMGGGRPNEQVTIHFNYGAQEGKALTKGMFTVDTADEVYTGSSITKTIVGQDGDRPLIEGTDYTVEYTENTHLGGVKITITGTGDYYGMLFYTFVIDLDETVKNDFLMGADGALVCYKGAQSDVVIPEGVVDILPNALMWGPMTSVSIPDTVTGNFLPKAVWEDTLTDIRVAEGNPSYSSQDGVLFNKDKTALLKYPAAKAGAYTVPDGVKTLGEESFCVAPGVTELALPGSVTEIAHGALRMENLAGIQVDESNPSFTARDGILFTKDMTGLVAYPATKAETLYMIPDGVTSIWETAFFRCTALKGAVLPKSLAALENWAFTGCNAMKDVYYRGSQEDWEKIEGSLDTGITVHYRYGAPSLSENMFVVDTTDAVYTGHPITKAIVGQNGDTALVEGQDYTVSYTDNLALGTAKITITGTGDYIGSLEYTFKIAHPDFQVSEDGTLTRYRGSETEVEIPEGVVKISDRAIPEQVTSLTLPSTVTEDLDTAMWGTGLTDIRVVADNPSYAAQDGVVFNKDKTKLVRYPMARTGAYAVPEGVTAIGEDAFDYCHLTGVTFPDTLTTLADGEFHTCEDLLSIQVSENNPNFSAQAGVLFNKDQTRLIRYPMAKAGAYVIPDGVTTIGKTAFSGCKGLTGVTFPGSLTELETQAFLSCAGLTDLEIPQGVTQLPPYAFAGCAGLTGLVIPGNVTVVGKAAFAECTGLTEVVVTEGVTSLGEGSFYSCSSLASVVIPKSMDTMLDPFAESLALTDIYYAGTEEEGKKFFGGIDPASGLTVHYNYGSSQTTALTRSMFHVNTDQEVYTGWAINKTITSELVRGTDYTVTYKNNVSAGTATIVITGQGDYTGTLRYSFIIARASLTQDMFRVDTSLETYTGSPITKTFSSYLTQGSDYTVDYQNNREVGTATIMVTGQGNYTGTLRYTFNIYSQFPAASGQLVGQERSLMWSSTTAGEIIVAGELVGNEKVMVACYDELGRLAGVKWITADQRTAQVDVGSAQVKLFWVDGKQKPMSPSETVKSE